MVPEGEQGAGPQRRGALVVGGERVPPECGHEGPEQGPHAGGQGRPPVVGGDPVHQAQGAEDDRPDARVALARVAHRPGQTEQVGQGRAPARVAAQVSDTRL